jgi:pyridoxal 5'-phosphate synthase pdxS subunit
MAEAKQLGAPFEVVRQISRTGKLPVPNFAAGGVATPADAALMMQLGAEAVFVGSGIFKVDLPDLESDDSVKRAAAYQRSLDISRSRARAIVQAVAHYADPAAVLAASSALDDKHGAMRGIQAAGLTSEQQLAPRGW